MVGSVGATLRRRGAVTGGGGRRPAHLTRRALLVLLTLVQLLALGVGPGASAAPPGPATPPPVAWARQAGGAGEDGTGGIAVADDGSTLWAGTFAGRATFGTGSGAITRTTAPTTGAFVASHDAAGDIRWLRTLTADAVDAWGADDRPGGGVVVVGTFLGDLRVDGGPVLASSGARRNLYVAALDADGTPEWVRTATGATHAVAARAVAVGDDGSVVAVGELRGTLDLGTAGSPVVLQAATPSPWVLSLDAAGTTRWARTLPTTGAAMALAVDVAADGGPVVGGIVAGLVDPGGTAAPVVTPGSVSGFVTALDPAGDGRWAERVGDGGTTLLTDVAVGTDGAVALAATVVGVPSALGTDLPAAGATDGVVAVLDADGTPRWTGGLAGPDGDALLGVALGADGTVTATGLRATDATAWSTEDRNGSPPVGSGTTAVVRWDATGAVALDASLDAGIAWDVDGPAGAEAIGTTAKATTSLTGRTLPGRGRADAVVLRLGPTVNRPPLVLDQALHASPDHDRPIRLSGDDPDGDALTWELTRPPSAGSVLGTLAGATPALTYRPNPGSTGVDSLEVTADDGHGGRTTRTIAVDVGANRPPTLTADPQATTSGEPVGLPLQATDPDGDPVALAVHRPPGHGMLDTATDPWTLHPTPGWAGVDEVVVRATDGLGGSTDVSIPVTIAAPGANRPPRRQPTPAATTIAGRPVTVALGIDDADGDAVDLALEGDPALGTATLAGGTLTYVPDGPLGTDVVAVRATDPHGAATTFELPVHVKRPNVVVVLTDDQTLEQLRWLPQTRALLEAHGTRFDDAVVSYAECCPSRATLLTGQYAHNHGVRSSAAPTGGVGRFDDTATLATWLDDAGYDTVLAGKYLNGYGTTVPPTYVPPGWDDWLALADPATYEYVGGRLSDDGTVVDLPASDAAYTTDLLADHVVAAVEAHEGSPTPLFALYSPVGPHVADGRGIAVPAARHLGSQPTATAPRGPAFDEADVADKPAALRALPRLTPDQIAGIDAEYRAAAESLASVDEGVARIWAALEAAGELDQTLVVVTSDNGFHYGEHRIRSGKSRPYEESVRVPLLIAGPGLPAGAVATQPVANVDLAPTIAGVAGVSATEPFDGVDLRAVAADPTRGRDRAVLLENGPLGGRPLHWGVRDGRWVYVQWSTGEKELYDRAADPAQLTNLATDPTQALRLLRYATLAAALRTCAGVTCQVGT